MLVWVSTVGVLGLGWGLVSWLRVANLNLIYRLLARR